MVVTHCINPINLFLLLRLIQKSFDIFYNTFELKLLLDLFLIEFIKLSENLFFIYYYRPSLSEFRKTFPFVPIDSISDFMNTLELNEYCHNPNSNTSGRMKNSIIINFGRTFCWASFPGIPFIRKVLYRKKVLLLAVSQC